MAALYADENVSHVLVDLLRGLGHDVLTALDDGRAGLGIGDPAVLARATALGRAVPTNNRGHYQRQHVAQPAHAGVVTYTSDDRNPPALAGRIHVAVTALPGLTGQCVKVIRPSRPPTP